MSNPNCAACIYCSENCLITDRCVKCKADLRDKGKKTGFKSGHHSTYNGDKRFRASGLIYHKTKGHSKIGASGGRGEH